MTNLGQFFGDKLPQLKRIGNINKQNEVYGDSVFATMGASMLAEKLPVKFPEAFEAFCLGRQISKEEALKRIQEESDQDFIAKIIPALLRDIPLTKESEGAYEMLIQDLKIPDAYKQEALSALQVAGSIKLEKTFN